MSKAPARALKVFQAQFGFYDTVVAVPSRAAALRAWGVPHDLFKTRLARIADDPKAIEAAQAHPGVVLKRAVGTDEPFTADPVELPTLPKAPKKTNRGGAPKPAPLPPKAPPPDRSAVDEAEQLLRDLEEHWQRTFADLRRRREEVDREWAAAEESYRKSKDAAVAAVTVARQAYRGAGGE